MKVWVMVAEVAGTARLLQVSAAAFDKVPSRQGLPTHRFSAMYGRIWMPVRLLNRIGGPYRF